MSKDLVMLDLETFALGTKPVIVQIGATVLDLYTGDFKGDFNLYVSPEDQVEKFNLEVWQSTLDWWKQQPSYDKVVHNPNQVTLEQALDKFSAWYKNGFSNGIVTGNGVRADNVWLSSAYAATGKREPWSYKNDFCFRSIMRFADFLDINPYEGIEFIGDKHDALADAKHQCRVIKAMYDEVMLWKQCYTINKTQFKKTTRNTNQVTQQLTLFGDHI